MSTSSVATLAEIRTLAQQYSDLVNSEFVTESEWNAYINLSYFELYDILIQKYGDDYYARNDYTIATDGSTYMFDLPSNFYKFLGLDLQLGNTQQSWVTIRPFMFGDRNRYAVPNFQSFYGVTNVRYRLFNNSLYLTPIPAANQTFRMWYVPRLTELTTDASTVDGVSGWQDYICLDAAIKAICKQELDPSALMARKQALLQRIESASENRDAGNPQVVTDSQWSDYFFPANGNTWGAY